MGSSFENEDSPPWLDCFLKSFSIENPLLENSWDSSSYDDSCNTYGSSQPPPLPPIDGFYTQMHNNYEQLNYLTDSSTSSDKWPGIIENCPADILDGNAYASSPLVEPLSSLSNTSLLLDSTPSSFIKPEVVSPPQAIHLEPPSHHKARKPVPKKSSRKTQSPKSLKQKRDEQACKKIAQCRLGFSLEKKVIIPIFLALILKERKYNPSTLRWIDKNSGIFKVEDQEKIAELWATMKKKSTSCYGNFSRSIRHHHHTGYLEHDRRKLIFKFSSDFTFWK